MKRNKIMIVFGILLVATIIMFVGWHYDNNKSAKIAESYVDYISSPANTTDSERPTEHDHEADMAADFTLSIEEDYGIYGVNELAELLGVKPYDSTQPYEGGNRCLIYGLKDKAYDMIEMLRRHVLMMKLSAVSELRRLEMNEK